MLPSKTKSQELLSLLTIYYEYSTPVLSNTGSITVDYALLPYWSLEYLYAYESVQVFNSELVTDKETTAHYYYDHC